MGRGSGITGPTGRGLGAAPTGRGLGITGPEGLLGDSGSLSIRDSTRPRQKTGASPDVMDGPKSTT